MKVFLIIPGAIVMQPPHVAATVLRLFTQLPSPLSPRLTPSPCRNRRRGAAVRSCCSWLRAVACDDMNANGQRITKLPAPATQDTAINYLILSR